MICGIRLFDVLSYAIGLIGIVIWIAAFFYSRITGKKLVRPEKLHWF